jgi:hypothetical protein
MRPCRNCELPALLVRTSPGGVLRRKVGIPKFVTIGYGDRAAYDRTPKEIRDTAHAHDAEMKKRGALIGVAGAPVQVRNPLAAGVRVENSTFMSSALPVAGFAVVEAADLAEAIKIVSRTPCAVAHGVVEVWPLERAD